MILERTYDRYSKLCEAIDGLPLPWPAGFESRITGFHERFNPHGIQNRGGASSYLDAPFMPKTAERLKLKK